MLYQVKTVNGQKTKIPLSDPAPTGNPIGTIISTYKKIQPKNYLYCDGSFFDEDQYPALYLYLGSNQLPDYRECVQVGAEQNTTDTIADHDVYTQGQFKDDQLQEHRHKSSSRQSYASGSGNYAMYGTTTGSEQNGVYDVYNARVGTTTHGKQKAVYVYIKAVDGVDITDEDTFLNTVKDYVDSMMTNWVDVSSDFSVVDSVNWANTPTSSLKVLYNAFQKKLKVWSWYNGTKSASDSHAFTLQYNGNNSGIVFNPATTTAVQTLNKAYLDYDASTGPEDSQAIANSTSFTTSYNIRTSKQIRLGGYNGNGSTPWGTNITIVAEISL